MLKKLGFHLLPKRRNQLPIECGVDTKVDEASHVRRAPIHCAALAPFFSFSFSFSSSCHSSQVCQKRRRTPATVLAFLLIQVIKITYFSLYNQFCRLHNFSMLFLFFFSARYQYIFLFGANVILQPMSMLYQISQTNKHIQCLYYASATNFSFYFLQALAFCSFIMYTAPQQIKSSSSFFLSCALPASIN